jgi:hypothetical protein
VTKPPDEDRPYGYRKAEPVAVHRLYRLVILTWWRHCSMSSFRLVLLGALLLPTILRARANETSAPVLCVKGSKRVSNSTRLSSVSLG